MSPDDLAAVDRSWAELRRRQGELVDHLELSFRAVGPAGVADRRAQWLVDAVVELVGLLGAPSRLGDRARRLAATWPVAGAVPSFAVDGRAWMQASRNVCSSWTDGTERAWRHAWLLLSDVLAEEALSPFADRGGAGEWPGGVMARPTMRSTADGRRTPEEGTNR